MPAVSRPGPEPPPDAQRLATIGGDSGARTFWRRRLVALALAGAAAVLVGRAIADDANHPPGFSGAAQEATVPEAPEPVRFTVAATGDFLIHSPVFAVALENGDGERYDFAPMFEQVKPYIEDAELAICHVETPMTDAPPVGFPVFNTPPDLARAIASTGWDICDTASNHTLDQGQVGIEQTNQALDRARIEHTGSYSSRAESERPLVVDVAGVKVALLAYTEMTNGIPLPEPWSVNLAKPAEILADARTARQRGADVVIVNLHAGEEFQQEPSKTQEKLAQALTRSDDVTAVIGQGVHLVQPIDEVNGKLVVYGEGNFVSNEDALCCPEAAQDGMIALLDFVVDEAGARVEGIRYVPIFVRRPDYVVLPVGDAMKAGEEDRSTLRASYQRTVDVVGERQGVEPVPRRLP